MINIKNRGFTLIEVIVSIAILGILAVTFMPILSNQYISIIGTGRKSEETYLAVDQVEQKIIKKDYLELEKEMLQIEFTELSKTIQVNVNYIEVETRDKPKGKESKIKVGIPE